MINYKYIYELYNCKGLGRVKVNEILDKFFCNSNASKLDINSILEDYLKKQNARNFDFEKICAQIEEVQDKLQQDILTIDFNSPLYPKSLHILEKYKPTILNCIGNLDLLKNRSIGFCGTRSPSEKGIKIAQDIAEQISSKEITIVSGYANGIDLEMHYGALKNNNSTIIVLAEGIKNFSIKPILKDVWDWNKVLIISEYQPNAIWTVQRAMERNATLVALSDIMVLIEAQIKSGSINAGERALALQKTLYVPFFKDMHELASGNEQLIKQGALTIKKSAKTKRANLDSILDFYNK